MSTEAVMLVTVPSAQEAANNTLVMSHSVLHCYTMIVIVQQHSETHVKQIHDDVLVASDWEGRFCKVLCMREVL